MSDQENTRKPKENQRSAWSKTRKPKQKQRSEPENQRKSMQINEI